MAVLPWGHSRTRTTSTEKKQHTPLDWFSRSTSEPSRQALTTLMKEHSRNISGGSGSAKARSETTTSHSHRSHISHQSRSSNQSHHSRHCSAKSEASNNSEHPKQQPRSVSPARSTVSAFDRPENSSRSRFSRPGALKRMSSKLSLSSDSASISGVIMISPPRFTASRIGFRKKDPISPEKDAKLSISKPFDFQHVSHTEQTAFEGLGRIDESDLVLQHDALQFGQQLETELRGIQTTDLGVVTPPQPDATSRQSLSLSSPNGVVARPVTPSSSRAFDLPMTPPGPTPPPKDLSLTTPSHGTDIRISRSMENFSRPTTRSPVAQSNSSPLRSLATQTQLAPAAIIIDGRASTHDVPIAKPLPSLPSVVHAVSTKDDTARYMIAAPLPSPPAYPTENGIHSNHKRQSSSRGSLRHMSTFPSAKNPTLLESQLRGIREEAEPLPRHLSDNTLSRHLARQDSQEFHRSSQTSIVNNLATDEWEDAIDEAWDQDSSDNVGREYINARSSILRPSGSQGSLLMVQQPVYDQSSTVSTPQMTMAAAHSSHNSMDIDSAYLSLYGLGIEPSKVKGTVKFPKPPSLQVSVPDHEPYSGSQRLPRTTYSALSKSSSQESIILSIASSIMGTQRSSNSSVGMGEVAQWAKVDDLPSATTSSASPLLSVGSTTAARPESTCIPASLLQGFTAPGAVPPTNTSLETKETQAVIPLAQEAEDHITPLASQLQYEKDASNICDSTPDNISSASHNSFIVPSRRRTSTSGSNRRPTRTSYSLFPTAARTTLNPPITT